MLRPGSVLIAFLAPLVRPELVLQLAEQKVTALSMDAIPRITRAQSMDALSSMSTIAGYKAVLLAANSLSKFFPLLMTAAGTIPPARVLVIGAGVAGLQAIATARRLGAVVEAFDTRPVVKEQVKSMGAEFLELDFEEDGTGEGGYAREMSPAFIKAEMELFAAQAKDVDIIITTALIPGKSAPLLITEEMVQSMKPGSVIVDLAAEAGGNCALTVPGEVVERYGVKIVGYADLPSRLAPTASQLYGNNLAHLLSDLGGAAKWHVDLQDEVIRGALVTHAGEITWPPPTPPRSPEAPKPAPSAPQTQPTVPTEAALAKQRAVRSAVVLAAVGALLGLLGLVAPMAFVSHLTVFVLACFVGWQVIWNVTPALHTPLMSVTNAISGIIIVGGMLQISGPIDSPVTILGALAILLATINIAGGFLVTQRMLRMFVR